MLRQFAMRLPPLLFAGGAAYGTGKVAAGLSADNAEEGRRLASPRDAERGSMDAWRRYRDSGDFADDMDARRSRTEPAAGFWNAPAGQALKNFWDGIRQWDADMSERSGWRVNMPGKVGDGASLAPDPLPTLQEILGAVHQPSGTQRVEVVNQQPPSINLGGITVYATTNADANQIAQQVGARVQDTIAGYYGTSAYG